MEDILLISSTGVIALIFSGFGWRLTRSLRRFVPPALPKKPYTDDTAPTVSLCIPARNEQHVMTDCLARALQSTYPKLEIIVLDDSSTDNTSALIKSFAHEGVRFVEGSPLPPGWLGKNHALQGLLNEASGDYILFLDVDTMLAPGAIDTLVRCAENDNVAMVSVLPRRNDDWRGSVFFSPLRYYWELIFHRRLAPASSSAAWLIRRDELLTRFDGFKAFRATFRPEAHIAAELSQRGRYRFYVSSPSFGVAYEKKWRSQLLTSIRLLFPSLGGKRSLSLFAMLDLLLLFSPFVTFWWALQTDRPFIAGAILSLGAAYAVLYGIYTHAVWQKGWYIGMLLWPIIVLQEALLIGASCIAHTMHKVAWKGRPIRRRTDPTRPEAQS